MRLKIGLFILAGAICSIQVHSDAALLQKPAAREFVHEMVIKEHFDEKQLLAILNQAQFQPQIIASMERPYEKKTWDVYQSLFLTEQRVQAGLAYWRENQAALAAAEQRFGVPADMIVSIIGIETLYGQHQGTYRVLDALSTLAFYYPKRAPFFTRELKEYLLLCREHGVPANQYLGSYAGAMGKPQFMPSSYRMYAVNMHGAGRPNLMSNDQDVIASVANYFHRHGWSMHQPVVQPAWVHGTAYRQLAANSKVADYTVARLRAAGVRPQGHVAESLEKAGLIALNTQQGSDHWLAYPNFYVITRYNTSPQYALVAYLFSQRLRTEWANLPQNNHSYASR